MLIYWLFKGGAGRGSGQAGRGREGRCKAVNFSLKTHQFWKFNKSAKISIFQILNNQIINK